VVKRVLTIAYEQELLASLGISEEEFSDEARFLLAAKLYELGRLTSGQAARLCQRDRVEFLFSLRRVGVAVSNLRLEDVDAELRFSSSA
jgi:predicted HTH domain antitoxin